MRKSVLAILAAALLGGAVGCSSPDPTGAAADALADLEVKGRAAQTGYDRTLFGEPWADVDRNGCDTRNDILRRDLENIETDGCTVYSGALQDPYSGTALTFVRGPETSEQAQIDHVVSLSEAWQKGAQKWAQEDPERLVEFANDPLNLLAVDGPLNMQKSDADAATWLPPNKAYRCEMVARQVAVKTKYELWVTAAERDAIKTVLNGCPGQQLPTGEDNNWPQEGAPAQTPTEVNPEESTPEPAGPTRYSTCKEAKAAGESRYQRGVDPQYEWYQDGDGDGIACE